MDERQEMSVRFLHSEIL